jgi:hypothetical protein
MQPMSFLRQRMFMVCWIPWFLRLCYAGFDSHRHHDRRGAALALYRDFSFENTWIHSRLTWNHSRLGAPLIVAAAPPCWCLAGCPA